MAVAVALPNLLVWHHFMWSEEGNSTSSSSSSWNLSVEFPEQFWPADVGSLPSVVQAEPRACLLARAGRMAGTPPDRLRDTVIGKLLEDGRVPLEDSIQKGCVETRMIAPEVVAKRLAKGLVEANCTGQRAKTLIAVMVRSLVAAVPAAEVGVKQVQKQKAGSGNSKHQGKETGRGAGKETLGSDDQGDNKKNEAGSEAGGKRDEEEDDKGVTGKNDENHEVGDNNNGNEKVGNGRLAGTKKDECENGRHDENALWEIPKERWEGKKNNSTNRSKHQQKQKQKQREAQQRQHQQQQQQQNVAERQQVKNKGQGCQEEEQDEEERWRREGNRKQQQQPQQQQQQLRQLTKEVDVKSLLVEKDTGQCCRKDEEEEKEAQEKEEKKKKNKKKKKKKKKNKEKQEERQLQQQHHQQVVEGGDHHKLPMWQPPRKEEEEKKEEEEEEEEEKEAQRQGSYSRKEQQQQQPLQPQGQQLKAIGQGCNGEEEEEKGKEEEEEEESDESSQGNEASEEELEDSSEKGDEDKEEEDWATYSAKTIKELVTRLTREERGRGREREREREVEEEKDEEGEEDDEGWQPAWRAGEREDRGAAGLGLAGVRNGAGEISCTRRQRREGRQLAKGGTVVFLGHGDDAADG